MSTTKAESTYVPYSYLPEAERPKTKMSTQFGRVPALDLKLDDAQQERVTGLLEDNIVISLHDHAYVLPEEVSEIVDHMATGRLQTGYAGLAASHLTAVFDNMAGPLGRITSTTGWHMEDVVHELGMRLADLAHQDGVKLGLTVQDILDAHANGTTAIVFGIETATPIENELERLDVLYGLGIRQMGIVYSDSNLLGSGLSEARDGGLTHFGRRAVQRMNALGVLIDVSHASDQTCLDTIEVSEHPVAITHAGARSVWPTTRMKPDDVLRACAESGGLLGIEAAPHSTISKAHPKHSLESVMEHFEFAVDLMGIDHVAFGPDTMWGDHVALHGVFSMGVVPSSTLPIPPHEKVAYVEGLEHPTEVFPTVVGWLVQHGYSDEDILKVVSGNVLRILGDVWR
jgi:membrane dipeptidase